MSRAESAADPAPVFAALGDATRLRLVTRLSDGEPRSITQLTGGLGLTRQGVTKHLRVLEEAGLVSSIRIGRESRFAFTPEPVARARSYLDTVSLQWDDALGRLQHFVEGEPDMEQARKPGRRTDMKQDTVTAAGAKRRARSPGAAVDRTARKRQRRG
jgi:DNA-binding transcriptional ArsR family regulator